MRCFVDHNFVIELPDGSQNLLYSWGRARIVMFVTLRGIVRLVR